MALAAASSIPTLAPKGRHRLKQMGLTRLGEIPPRPIAGVRQYAIRIDPDRLLGPQLPSRCLKCGNPHLYTDGHVLMCRPAGCGSTWVLVTGPPLNIKRPRGRKRKDP